MRSGLFLPKLGLVVLASLAAWIGSRTPPPAEFVENAPLILGYGIFPGRIEVMVYFPRGMRESRYTAVVGQNVVEIAAPGDSWEPERTVVRGAAGVVRMAGIRQVEIRANNRPLYSVPVRGKNERFEFSGARDATTRKPLADKNLWLPVEEFSVAGAVADTTAEKALSEEEVQALAEKEGAEKAEQDYISAVGSAFVAGRKYKVAVEAKFYDRTGSKSYVDSATLVLKSERSSDGEFSGKIVKSTSRAFASGKFFGEINARSSPPQISLTFNLRNRDRSESVFSVRGIDVQDDGSLVGILTNGQGSAQFFPLEFTPPIPPAPPKDAAAELPGWLKPFAAIMQPGGRLQGTIGERPGEQITIEVENVHGHKLAGKYSLGRAKKSGTVAGVISERSGSGELSIQLDPDGRHMVVGAFGGSFLGAIVKKDGTDGEEVVLRLAPPESSKTKSR